MRTIIHSKIKWFQICRKIFICKCWKKSHTNVTITYVQVNEMDIKKQKWNIFITHTPCRHRYRPIYKCISTRNNILIDESNFGIRRKFAIRIVSYICLNIKFKCVIIFSRNLLYAAATATAAASHTLGDLCCVCVCVCWYLFHFFIFYFIFVIENDCFIWLLLVISYEQW